MEEALSCYRITSIASSLFMVMNFIIDCDRIVMNLNQHTGMKVNKTVELAGTHCWLADWRFTLYNGHLKEEVQVIGSEIENELSSWIWKMWRNSTFINDLASILFYSTRSRRLDELAFTVSSVSFVLMHGHSILAHTVGIPPRHNLV